MRDNIRYPLFIITALLLLAVTSCGDDPAAPEPVIVSEATIDFEATWRVANQWYPLFNFKGINWQTIYNQYRSRAEQTPDSEIYDFLHDLLGELEDAHAFYRDSFFMNIYPFTPRRLLEDHDLFSLDVVKTYFSNDLLLAGHGRINFGKTDNNIGYVHISSLAETGMMDDFHVVMDTVRHTDGLIIDVRGNLGGIEGNAEVVIGQFIDSPMASFEAFTVLGPVTFPAYEPDTSAATYTRPVVILINGACASAPEALAEMMKRIPTVTLVGDTTAGAGCWSSPGAPGTTTLPSGRIIYVPTTYMLRLDGQPWEWNGILPDTLVEQTQQDILSGIDRQFEAALDLLD